MYFFQGFSHRFRRLRQTYEIFLDKAKNIFVGLAYCLDALSAVFELATSTIGTISHMGLFSKWLLVFWKKTFYLAPEDFF
jgi:hypothetical protein